MSQVINKSNPADTGRKAEKAERARIPMSIPQQKLSVPEIPGFHLHWMLGTPSRIAQAKKAGYDFVDPEEVDVVNTGLADDLSKSGNTDMGSRVSLVAGGTTGDDGQEQRLYLMKIPQEFWEADQAALEDRNEQIATTLRGGQVDGGSDGDTSNRYIPDAHRKNVANLFNRKPRRA